MAVGSRRRLMRPLAQPRRARPSWSTGRRPRKPLEKRLWRAGCEKCSAPASSSSGPTCPFSHDSFNEKKSGHLKLLGSHGSARAAAAVAEYPLHGRWRSVALMSSLPTRHAGR